MVKVSLATPSPKNAFFSPIEPLAPAYLPNIVLFEPPSLLDKLITDPNIVSQIVNIGPDEEFITINELFRNISNKLQFNQNPTYVKDRPNEVKYASCSSNKARELLNYKTQVPLSDSLDKLIDFIKKKGPKEFKYNYMLEIDNEKTPQTWKNKHF